MQHSKIAIIGAGVSGLVAAVALAEHSHHNIVLFEARKEAGGRTRSYTDAHTGDVLDNGQHLLLGCYRSTLKYLQAIGSDRFLQRVPLSIYFHEASRKIPAHVQLSAKSKPPLNLLAGLWSSKLLTNREKIAATRLGFAINSTSIKDVQAMTCEELFQKFHQPERLIETLWAPMILATINASIEKASALLFVNVLREAFFSIQSASDLLIPSVGLSELLIEPALRALEKRGVEIRLSTPIRAIEEKDNHLSIVTNDTNELFNAVIYCGQSSDPLPQKIRATIPEFEYSPIVNAYFWLDREILSTPIHSFLGTKLQWAFPRPSVRFSQRLALTVSAADALALHSNDEIQHILWMDLCSALPEAREARLMHFQIIREKRATPLFTPSIQNQRPGTVTSIPGLWLAGDIVQNGLPATIEGAAHNGYAAAEAVRAHYPSP